MTTKEIGSCQCILESIKTRIDGSVTISVSIDPSNQEILSKLLSCFSTGEKLLQIAIIKIKQ